MSNQRDRILEHLRSGKTLTRLNSFKELGVIEAPARISELRTLGHDIQTTMITVKNRFDENVRVAKWHL